MSDESNTDDRFRAATNGPGSPLISHHSSLITTHSIRLRGAWVASSDGSATRHSRNFGRPRTLDPNERLWLVCAHVPGLATVYVNGRAIAADVAAGTFAADITDSLQLRNTVSFLVESDVPLGDVALEVRMERQ